MDKFTKLKNGNKIHYLQFGKGEPLVLLPSLWLTSKSYADLGKQLGKYYKVFVPDLYKGKSFFSDRALDIDDYAVELVGFIKQMHLENYFLVGASFSGIIACKFVLNYSPRPKKLLLVSTTVLPFKMKSQFFNLFRGYIELFCNNTYSLKGIRVNLMWVADAVGYAKRHLKQFVLEWKTAGSLRGEEIATLPVPTKLIFAKKDEFIPFKVVKKLRKVKNLEVEVVDKFHGWFFRREKELAQKIINFLR